MDICYRMRKALSGAMRASGHSFDRMWQQISQIVSDVVSVPYGYPLDVVSRAAANVTV